MKRKALISALAGVLIAGSTATTFAAANPFSDVPANNWAYAAVQKLAADGVVNGFGNSEFHGNELMTRYQMAQIVAKAMTYENLTKADKALVDKLAAEYSAELENLGVRVSNLEKKSDNVKFTGYAQYAYLGEKTPELKKGATAADSRYVIGNTTSPTNQYQFRFWVNADIGNGWTATSRICYYINANEANSTNNASVARMYVSKDFGKVQAQFGKMSNWSDYVVNTGFVLNGGFFSGALLQTNFGKDNAYTATVAGGRMQFDSSLNNKIDKARNTSHYLDGSGNGFQAELGWAPPKSKLSANVGYYHFNDFEGPNSPGSVGDFWSDSQVSSAAQKQKDFNGATNPYTYTKNDLRLTNSNNIWVGSLGYQFDKNIKLMGGYGKSSIKANNNYLGDAQNKAYTVALVYKAPVVLDTDTTKVGSWNAYLGYVYQGDAVTKYGAGLYEIAGPNMKGWETGLSYVPAYNVEWILAYFTGKQLNINYGNNDANIKAVYTELDFFF